MLSRQGSGIERWADGERCDSGSPIGMCTAASTSLSERSAAEIRVEEVVVADSDNNHEQPHS